MRLQRFLECAKAFGARRQRQVAADVGDLPMAEPEQVPGGEPRGGRIVDAEPRRVERPLAADELHVRVILLEQRERLRRVALEVRTRITPAHRAETRLWSSS